MTGDLPDDMYERAYFGVQDVLDRALGAGWTAGVGGGIVADVELVAQRAEREAAAADLLAYALHLRMHGERARGGDETWEEFDRRAESFLRARCSSHVDLHRRTEADSLGKSIYDEAGARRAPRRG